MRHADLQQRPSVLRIVGEVAAGGARRPRIWPGTCSRIYPVEGCRPAWLLPPAAATQSKGGWVRCELARLVNRESGLAVTAVPSQSIADLVSAGQADGVMLLPPDPTLFAAGQLVAFRPWRALP